MYILLSSFSLLLLALSNVKEEEDGPSEGLPWPVAIELKFRERRADRKLGCLMGFNALFKREAAIDSSGLFS